MKIIYCAIYVLLIKNQKNTYNNIDFKLKNKQMAVKKKKIDILVGQNVANVRNHLRYNQLEFSKILGIKQGSLSQLEKGIVSLTAERLEILIKELNVSPNYIYGVSELMFLTDFEDKSGKIIQRIEALEKRIEEEIEKRLLLLSLIHI